jgi:hypothetical protein
MNQLLIISEGSGILETDVLDPYDRKAASKVDC